MGIFASFTPLVEPISLDEAFLDVTNSRAAFGEGVAIARQLKSRVRNEIGLTLSVGVATNKLCAKVASDLCKPDALVVVGAGQEATFLAPLPIRRLWGVGPRLQQALADHGVSNIGDLTALSDVALRRRFGVHGMELARRARGIDPSPVAGLARPKSIGHEHTFSRDVVRRGRMEVTLLDLADAVSARLRAHGLVTGGVQLKLRFEGFETILRQARLPAQTRECEPLYAAGLALLNASLVPGRAVRLIGLTAISLSDREQLTLFDAHPRSQRLSESVDAVRRRFGQEAITRARLLTGRPQRRFDFGERPGRREPLRPGDAVGGS
jgi:DNA polymerase-4